MPGRSHREKGAVAFSAAEAFDCVQAGARSPQGCVKRSRGGDSVLVEVSAPAEAMILDALDVRRVVNDLEFSSCCPTGLERDGHCSGR